MSVPHICEAARAGDIEWLADLVRQGHSVHSRDVVRAARAGRSLPSLTPRPPPRHQYANTPIHWAAYGGHSRCVRLLLKLGASSMSVNEVRWPLLPSPAAPAHPGRPVSAAGRRCTLRCAAATSPS